MSTHNNINIHSNTDNAIWEEEAAQAAFTQIPNIFPQLAFIYSNNNWISPKRIDGSDPSKPRKDKTIIRHQLPGVVYTNASGKQAHNLFTVYAELNKIERWEARKAIGQIIGKELPSNPRHEIHKKRHDILANAQAYFTYCLHNSTNGKAVLEYLTNVRKWATEEIEAAQLGAIPSQSQLIEHLLKNGFTETEINEALKLHKAIGESHILTIPRTTYGQIKDFNFRCIGNPPEGLDKYLRQNKTEGEPVTLTYLPWKHDGDIILVEGELDALRAQAKGLNNIVAIGSQKVNEAQLKHAKERGFKKVSICLDAEPGKEKTKAAAIEHIATQAEKLDFSVYVIHLPNLNETKTDLDTYLNEYGAQDFRNLANSSSPAEMQSISTWRVFELCLKYQDKEISDKDKEDILDGIVKIGLGVKPLLRSDYYTQVNNLIGEYIPVDIEAIETAIERIKKAEELEEQTNRFKDGTTKIQGKLNSGLITLPEAAELIDSLTQSIKETGIDYDKYLRPTKWEEQKQAALLQPEGLKTGYYTTNDKGKIAEGVSEETPNQYALLLPAKAVTVVAGRSGHGKTMYMLNLAIQVILNQPGQKFYYFTYEMPEDQLLLRALNTYIGLTVGQVSKWQSKALFQVFTKDNYQYIQAHKREETKQAVNEFKTLLHNGNLVLREVMGLPIEDLAGIVKMLHKHGAINGLFVDYIQRINSKKVKGTGGIETLKQVSNVFNEIANQTGLPIITGAQFNREVSHLADISEYALREADDITHMAALILGMWNNNYVLTDRKGSKQDPEADEYNKKKADYHVTNTIYTKVLKYRFGEIGAEFLLSYNSATQSLFDYDVKEHHKYEPQ
jgi:DNA primase